ncbi:hypothetical protein [Bufonid herpesvirus 1]|uniref:hypothetical protein n=1 Tax=Bufonid herpesvirus 1 TaxID=2282206 RepID=UPI000EB70D8E|nr:hypothetical protein [Bufonid herpesvirus 1]AXF48585.1 hypothetical protein [Bufonid herpesvirus 1]
MAEYPDSGPTPQMLEQPVEFLFEDNYHLTDEVSNKDIPESLKEFFVNMLENIEANIHILTEQFGTDVTKQALIENPCGTVHKIRRRYKAFKAAKKQNMDKSVVEERFFKFASWINVVTTVHLSNIEDMLMCAEEEPSIADYIPIDLETRNQIFADGSESEEEPTDAENRDAVMSEKITLWLKKQPNVEPFIKNRDKQGGAALRCVIDQIATLKQLNGQFNLKKEYLIKAYNRLSTDKLYAEMLSSLSMDNLDRHKGQQDNFLYTVEKMFRTTDDRITAEIVARQKLSWLVETSAITGFEHFRLKSPSTLCNELKIESINLNVDLLSDFTVIERCKSDPALKKITEADLWFRTFVRRELLDRKKTANSQAQLVKKDTLQLFGRLEDLYKTVEDNQPIIMGKLQTGLFSVLGECFDIINILNVRYQQFEDVGNWYTPLNPTNNSVHYELMNEIYQHQKSKTRAYATIFNDIFTSYNLKLVAKALRATNIKSSSKRIKKEEMLKRQSFVWYATKNQTNRSDDEEDENTEKSTTELFVAGKIKKTDKLLFAGRVKRLTENPGVTKDVLHNRILRLMKNLETCYMTVLKNSKQNAQTKNASEKHQCLQNTSNMTPENLMQIQRTFFKASQKLLDETSCCMNEELSKASADIANIYDELKVIKNYNLVLKKKEGRGATDFFNKTLIKLSTEQAAVQKKMRAERFMGFNASSFETILNLNKMLEESIENGNSIVKERVAQRKRTVQLVTPSQIADDVPEAESDTQTTYKKLSEAVLCALKECPNIDTFRLKIDAHNNDSCNCQSNEFVIDWHKIEEVVADSFTQVKTNERDWIVQLVKTLKPEKDLTEASTIEVIKEVATELSKVMTQDQTSANSNNAFDLAVNSRLAEERKTLALETASLQGENACIKSELDKLKKEHNELKKDTDLILAQNMTHLNETIELSKLIKTIKTNGEPSQTDEIEVMTKVNLGLEDIITGMANQMKTKEYGKDVIANKLQTVENMYVAKKTEYQTLLSDFQNLKFEFSSYKLNAEKGDVVKNLEKDIEALKDLLVKNEQLAKTKEQSKDSIIKNLETELKQCEENKTTKSNEFENTLKEITEKQKSKERQLMVEINESKTKAEEKTVEYRAKLEEKLSAIRALEQRVKLLESQKDSLENVTKADNSAINYIEIINSKTAECDALTATILTERQRFNEGLQNALAKQAEIENNAHLFQKELQNTIESLTSHNKELTKKLSLSTKECTTMYQKVEACQQQYNVVNQSFQGATNLVESQKKEINILKQKEEELKTCVVDNMKLKKEIEALQTIQTQYEGVIAELRLSNDTTNKAAASSEKKKRQLEEEKKKVETAQKNLAADYQAIKTRLVNAETNVAENKRTVEHLNKELAVTQQLSTKQKTTIEQLKYEQEQITKQMANKAEIIESMTELLNNCNTYINNLQLDNSRNEELLQQQNQKTAMMECLSTYLSSYHNLSSELSSLRNAIETGNTVMNVVSNRVVNINNGISNQSASYAETFQDTLELGTVGQPNASIHIAQPLLDLIQNTSEHGSQNFANIGLPQSSFGEQYLTQNDAQITLYSRQPGINVPGIVETALTNTAVGTYSLVSVTKDTIDAFMRQVLDQNNLFHIYRHLKYETSNSDLVYGFFLMVYLVGNKLLQLIEERNKINDKEAYKVQLEEEDLSGTLIFNDSYLKRVQEWVLVKIEGNTNLQLSDLHSMVNGFITVSTATTNVISFLNSEQLRHQNNEMLHALTNDTLVDTTYGTAQIPDVTTVDIQNIERIIHDATNTYDLLTVEPIEQAFDEIGTNGQLVEYEEAEEEADEAEEAEEEEEAEENEEEDIGDSNADENYGAYGGVLGRNESRTMRSTTASARKQNPQHVHSPRSLNYSGNTSKRRKLDVGQSFAYLLYPRTYTDADITMPDSSISNTTAISECKHIRDFTKQKHNYVNFTLKPRYDSNGVWNIEYLHPPTRCNSINPHKKGQIYQNHFLAIEAFVTLFTKFQQAVIKQTKPVKIFVCGDELKKVFDTFSILRNCTTHTLESASHIITQHDTEDDVPNTTTATLVIRYAVKDKTVFKYTPRVGTTILDCSFPKQNQHNKELSLLQLILTGVLFCEDMFAHH